MVEVLESELQFVALDKGMGLIHSVVKGDGMYEAVVEAVVSTLIRSGPCLCFLRLPWYKTVKHLTHSVKGGNGSLLWFPRQNCFRFVL